MDLSKLSTADKVIAGATILLFISMFLPWFGVDVSGVGAFDSSFKGWHYFLFGTFPLLLALIMVAQIAVTRFSPQTNLPTLPIGWGQVHLIAGGLAAVIIVLKLLIGDSYFGFDLDRKFGLFVSTIAALALAGGAFLKFQEEKAGGGAVAPGPGPGTAPPTPF